MSSYYWGGNLGATLGAGGISVPYDAKSRGLGEPGTETDDTDLWADLYRDPLAELVLAAASSGGGRSRETPPGALLPSERPRAMLDTLRDRITRSGDADGGTGLGPGLVTAIADLARSPLLGPAAQTLEADTPEGGDALARVLARAVAAAAIGAALDDGTPVICDGAARDAAVDLLTQTMGARPRGSDRGFPALLARPALRFASRQAVRRRRALTDAAHPAAGDVLLYLARGEPLREGLREVVRALPPPVALICHSLGGIIALDTLLSTPLPQVELLVTVGSQSPFLYEIGALPGLAYPEPLPARVPAWLNIYDPRDLLGYVGAPLFPGRVRDIEVDNRQPFPIAHSAYWSNHTVYRAIAAELP